MAASHQLLKMTESTVSIATTVSAKSTEVEDFTPLTGSSTTTLSDINYNNSDPNLAEIDNDEIERIKPIQRAASEPNTHTPREQKKHYMLHAHSVLSMEKPLSTHRFFRQPSPPENELNELIEQQLEASTPLMLTHPLHSFTENELIEQQLEASTPLMLTHHLHSFTVPSQLLDLSSHSAHPSIMSSNSVDSSEMPSHLVGSSMESSHLIRPDSPTMSSHLISSGSPSMSSHLIKTSSPSKPSHLIQTSSPSRLSHLIKTSSSFKASHLIQSGSPSRLSHLVSSGSPSMSSHLITTSSPPPHLIRSDSTTRSSHPIRPDSLTPSSHLITQSSSTLSSHLIKPGSPILPSHFIESASSNHPVDPSHNFIAEHNPIPDKKNQSTSKKWMLSISKALLAFFSSSTFAINSNIGAYKTADLLDPDFSAPENFAALTKTGLIGPWYTDLFALIAGFCSLVINIYQFYDFAPQLNQSYHSQIKPILKKIYDGRFTELTKKEYIILLVGMGLSTTAAMASAKIAWDATKDSPEWYFHIFLGLSNVIATFGMTFLTRSVSTKRLIDNTALFYSKDKRAVLPLFQKLTIAKTKLQSNFLLPPHISLTISHDDRTQVTEWFLKYRMDIPDDIDQVISIANNNFQTAWKTFQDSIQKGLLSLFALTNVMMAWCIYMEKLASLLPVLEIVGIEKICWDIMCAIISIIGSSPHVPLFYYATMEIFTNIKDAFLTNPSKTLFAMIGTLPTSFGLFNVDLGVEKHSYFITLPPPNTPLGWIMPILSFFDAYWVNLNSLLKRTVLKDVIVNREQTLKDNPYHALVQKIIREEPTQEDTDLKLSPGSLQTQDVIPTHLSSLEEPLLSPASTLSPSSSLASTISPSSSPTTTTPSSSSPTAKTSPGSVSRFFNRASNNALGNHLSEPLLNTEENAKASSPSFIRQGVDYVRSFCGSRNSS